MSLGFRVAVARLVERVSQPTGPHTALGFRVLGLGGVECWVGVKEIESSYHDMGI